MRLRDRLNALDRRAGLRNLGRLGGRRPGQDLASHLRELTAVPFGGGLIADDLRVVLARVEALEARVTALEADRR